MKITAQAILTANRTHPTAEVTAEKFEAARLKFGITDPQSVAALLANCEVESSLIPQREAGYYRTADRLRAVYPSFFDPTRGGRADPAAYLQNPGKLFSFVYANRGGNGNEASGEGFRYRGGGFIQTTFKSGYKATGALIGFDLIAHPERIEEIGVSALAACAYWTRLSAANACAVQGDIAGTRRAVNGRAMLGLNDMLSIYRRLLPLLK